LAGQRIAVRSTANMGMLRGVFKHLSNRDKTSFRGIAKRSTRNIEMISRDSGFVLARAPE